jgi:hypothetical protein
MKPFFSYMILTGARDALGIAVITPAPTLTKRQADRSHTHVGYLWLGTYWDMLFVRLFLKSLFQLLNVI